LFCLVADVTIRERTHNRKSLQDALRGVLNGGGDISKDWDIERALAQGDNATGTHVLRDLYRQMRDKPSPADLRQHWKKRGVQLKEGAVSFNDKAPQAAIRKAIASPPVSALSRSDRQGHPNRLSSRAP